jgi:DNA repair exonuclease SbcCD ATPase subunit
VDLAEYKTNLSTLGGLNGSEKVEMDKKLGNQMRAMKRNIVVLKKEIKSIEAGAEKVKYEKLVEEQDTQLKELEKQYKTVKEGAKAGAEGATPNAGNAGNPIKVYDQAIELQDQSIDVMRRAVNYGEHSVNISQDIQQTLAQQTERMRDIDEELNTLQGQLQRAKKELVWFVRQAMSDKCFICILALVVLLVVAVVVIMVIQKATGKFKK